MCSCFPAAFQLPPFASWPSCSRRRYPLSSRSAYQWLTHRTATGFPCFTLLRCDRCRAPPILRDRGAPVADIETPATTAASQRRVLFLRCCLHLPEFWVTKLAGVHFRSPFPAFPLPVTSGWNAGPWAFLPGFTPRRYQRRMPGAGTGAEHSPGVNRRSFDPPFRLSRSNSATSCRTSTPQWPRLPARMSAGLACQAVRLVIPCTVSGLRSGFQFRS